MILRGEKARRYFSAPDPQKAGLLIAGADSAEVNTCRRKVISALIGPEGEAQMRLTRMNGAELRKDKTLLTDAVGAIGFFPGQRVVSLEDATDSLTPLIENALEKRIKGSAVLIVTASTLTGKSSLKALFQKHPNAYCAMLYDDPPSRVEIEMILKANGFSEIDASAMRDLEALAHDLERGNFRQLIEKLSLYKYKDDAPLSQADIAFIAPATLGAGTDDLLHTIAEGRSNDIGRFMQRLSGQGVQPVSLCIQALRHFNALYTAKNHPGGISSGFQKARVFGPRRDRMEKQVKLWELARLEKAISLLLETDLKLRSSPKVPAIPLLERAFIRLAMLCWHN